MYVYSEFEGIIKAHLLWMAFKTWIFQGFGKKPCSYSQCKSKLSFMSDLFSNKIKLDIHGKISCMCLSHLVMLSKTC